MYLGKRHPRRQCAAVARDGLAVELAAPRVFLTSSGGVAAARWARCACCCCCCCCGFDCGCCCGGCGGCGCGGCGGGGGCGGCGGGGGCGGCGLVSRTFLGSERIFHSLALLILAVLFRGGSEEARDRPLNPNLLLLDRRISHSLKSLHLCLSSLCPRTEIELHRVIQLLGPTASGSTLGLCPVVQPPYASQVFLGLLQPQRSALCRLLQHLRPDILKLRALVLRGHTLADRVDGLGGHGCVSRSSSSSSSSSLSLFLSLSKALSLFLLLLLLLLLSVTRCRVRGGRKGRRS